MESRVAVKRHSRIKQDFFILINASYVQTWLAACGISKYGYLRYNTRSTTLRQEHVFIKEIVEAELLNAQPHCMQPDLSVQKFRHLRIQLSVLGYLLERQQVSGLELLPV